LPNLSTPIQPRIKLPGSEIKSRMKSSILKTIDTIGIEDLPSLSVSSVDLKQYFISIALDSFGGVEETIRPVLNTINRYKKSKDDSPGSIFGVSAETPDPKTVDVIPAEALKKAFSVIETISLTPYPAVLLAPALFRRLHPILSQDDLPTWDRLSPNNFLFVVFLDEWCTQGKKGGGFFENP
jgi:hypothetical protein